MLDFFSAMLVILVPVSFMRHHFQYTVTTEMVAFSAYFYLFIYLFYIYLFIYTTVLLNSI